jgi:hypothetical protein
VEAEIVAETGVDGNETTKKKKKKKEKQRTEDDGV